MNTASESGAQQDILKDINDVLHSIQRDHRSLSAAVKDIQDRLGDFSTNNPTRQSASRQSPNVKAFAPPSSPDDLRRLSLNGLDGSTTAVATSRPTIRGLAQEDDTRSESPSGRASTFSNSKVILSTYPGQSGIDPVPLRWGDPDPARRGPIVVSRALSTIRRRNGK